MKPLLSSEPLEAIASVILSKDTRMKTTEYNQQRHKTLVG